MGSTMNTKLAWLACTMVRMYVGLLGCCQCKAWRGPSLKGSLALLSIVPLTLAVWVLALPTLRGFSGDYKSPPFPDTVEGKKAVWVADKQLINLANSFDVSDIEFVELTGDGDTNMPRSITIHSKRNIRLIRNGLLHAKKRLYVKLNGGLWNDLVVIHFRPLLHRADVTIPFFADVIEGETIGANTGTISPEFQDALRSLGVSKRDDLNPVCLYLVNLPYQFKTY